MLHISLLHALEWASRALGYLGAKLGEANKASNSHIRVRMLSLEVLITFNPVTSTRVYSPFTMIFPTTFILTLFLAPIARAVPQPCYDSISPGSSAPNGQHNLVGPGPVIPAYKAVYNPIYDTPTESLDDVACSNLHKKYPEFIDIPFFPFIGGAFNTSFDSTHCGAIWNISNTITGKHIRFVSIDSSSAFDLSEHAFLAVGGNLSAGSVEVHAKIVGYIPK